MRVNSHLTINSSIHNYNLHFQKTLEVFAADLVIIDSIVSEKYSELRFENSHIFTSSEGEKTLGSVEKLLDIFSRSKLNRESTVTVIGGGVLQDLSTLACSIYMRGIKWTYYPTTLQSMIDSCIGGKSSINLNQKKNLVGNYYPPSEIFISTEFLKTLTQEQLVCGLIEGLKISAAGTSDECDTFLRIVHDFESKSLMDLNYHELIYFSLKIKRRFIEIDEYDNGFRKLLNYGHTFGHAIESSANYRISHGVAVGIGILVAHDFSRSIGLIDEQITRVELAVIKLLRKIDNELKMGVSNIDYEIVHESIVLDKKANNENFVFILPTKNGLVRHQTIKSSDNVLQVKNSISNVIKIFL